MESDIVKLAHSGELAMVATLGVAVGLMSVDQNSPSYLMPFVKPALQLDNAQIGAAVSAYWVMFAIGSSLAGAASEQLSRKRLLVLILASFAVCSVLPSVARNFTQFAAARGVMGLLAGAMFALCQSILARGSSPTTVGRNMGLVTGFAGNAFGMIIGPVVLVQVAVALGWRAGFLTVIAPMVLCALFAWAVLREPEPLLARGRLAKSSSFTEISDIRNIWLCGLLCSLFVAYVSLGLAFLPLYLMEARNLTSAQMSLLISLLGLSAIVTSVVLPFVADRIGRKPTLVAASLLSMGAPLAALYLESPLPVLGVVLFFGWGIAGTGSFWTGTIPSESVPARLVAKSLGLIIAIGVLVGGLVGPSLAGFAADRWGMGAPLQLLMGCVLLSAMLSLALRETAPGRRVP